MAVDTMFQNSGSGSGSGSSDYIEDNFLDTSNKASNNSGLSSTALKNPLSFYLNDTNTPQYATKTLFIKELALIEDRSKWVDLKPTYEIVWTENNESVKGYVVGTVRMRQVVKGKCVEIIETGDLIGLSGVVRQVAWLVNSTSQTGTALRYTDGVAGTNVTFGSAQAATDGNGVNSYLPLLHNSSLEDENIHDFRVAANQYGVLQVVGVVVYTQNATTNINVNPGETYVEKTLVTQTSDTALSLPTVTSKIGALNTVKQNSSATPSLDKIEAPYINSVAVGFIDTNLINVSVGTGASFPIGTGVAAISGTSYYVGFVTNQSTDTLTVSPTLPFGLSSNNIYKVWTGIPTLAISATLYSLKKCIDFSTQNNTIEPNGFFNGQSFCLFNSDRETNYRIWGQNLMMTSADGVGGLGFNGNTNAFFQVDGEYSAAEIEYHGQGIMNATLCINGIPAWSINAGVTGSFKRTVLTNAGPGWNSFVFAPGQSYIGAVVTKVNLYEMASGTTLGLLATFPSYMDTLNRTSGPNASMMVLGAVQRTYADELYLGGLWTRGVSHTFAGAVAYYGATANCSLTFNYYGTNFAFIGTAGASMTCTLDGASNSFAFNTWNSVPTLQWHSVALNYTGGATCILHAVDYLRSQTGEFKNKQNYVPYASLKNTHKTFVTQYTPQNASDGDIWVQKKSVSAQQYPIVWLKIFGFWAQLNIGTVSDDPNATLFVRTHGSSTGADNAGGQDGEIFNNSAWSTATSSTLGATSRASACNSSFGTFHTIIDGITTAGATSLRSNYFNRVAWSTFTQRGTAKSMSGSVVFNGFLYSNRGSTASGDPANGTAVADKWSGAAWSSGTAWAQTRVTSGFWALQSTGLQSGLGGADTGAAATTAHETRTVADVISTATAVPATISTCNGSSVNTALGLIANAGAVATASTASYSWNGSAWSASIATFSLIGDQANGQAAMQSKVIKNGGNTVSASTPVATSDAFNGSAFSSLVASGTARGKASSSAV